MTVQKIVDSGNIESELITLWESVAKEKMRACLFNLIVYNRLSARTDYIRGIVQKVSEKYPCRVIFISSDPEANKPYLKTAVSVVGEGTIACDYIDVGGAGSEIEKVPFVILPHIIPDLPVSLLWTEDPSEENLLFEPLSKLASRVIFDSESADTLIGFCGKVLSMHVNKGIDTADLNWARMEGWRDLIASIFQSKEHLDQIDSIKITYNAKATEFFCHLKVQSLYLLSWISSRLNWKFKRGTKELKFEFENQKAEILTAEWEKLGPGTIISVEITTKDGHLFHSARIPDQYHYVTVHHSSLQQCELPYQYLLGKTATGQTLIKEIITKGTSFHYLATLKNFQELDRENLC